MKEVITIKMVEQKTVEFIADDGAKFDKESDCRSYEYRKKQKEYEKDFETKLDKQKLHIPVLEDYMCDGSVEFITLHSRADIDRIFNFYKSYNYSDLRTIEPLYKITNFPTKITIVDNGYDYCWLYDTDQLLTELQKVIDNINGVNKNIPNNTN